MPRLALLRSTRDVDGSWSSPGKILKKFRFPAPQLFSPQTL